MTSSLALRTMLALTSLFAVGCSSSAAPTLPAGATHFVKTSLAKAAAVMYVSDPLSNAVDTYSVAGHHQSPTGTITKGIQGPAGVTTDDSGNLYVANTAGNTVTEYAPKGSSPLATYGASLLGPVDVAVDDAGTVYVANFYSFGASIVEFPNQSTAPSHTIRNPCSCYPIGLALDGKENLYVAYNDFYSQTLVYEYAQGSTKGVAVNYQFGQTRFEVAGLAFDESGALLAADATLPGIQVFPAGSDHSSRTFGKKGSPRFVAFDAGEHSVFVTDTVANAVEEYSYPAGKLTNVITNGLKSAYGVALSPRAPL